MTQWAILIDKWLSKQQIQYSYNQKTTAYAVVFVINKVMFIL
ncbi:hypothetical protein AOT82_2385 [Psychrobacter sp. AntiMn-1]|nr:hypothetical protein AOT82_2385 [Psychrobacter sp. AntiMn-1]